MMDHCPVGGTMETQKRKEKIEVFFVFLSLFPAYLSFTCVFSLFLPSFCFFFFFFVSFSSVQKNREGWSCCPLHSAIEGRKVKEVGGDGKEMRC